ncbi:MAG: hypothetical protein QXR45_06345 [Candidatus Bathyarchaeia archaeon]
MTVTQHFRFIVLSSVIFLAITTESANAGTKLSVTNPGLDGYPSKWTAGKPRYVDMSMFEFYSNETQKGSTFFVNITVYDVTCLAGWGIGLTFNKEVLSYVSAWLPFDHVFKPVEDMGWTIVAPPVVVEPINETHSIIKWGYAYIMPESEVWTFNGTGTLCQIQFKIIENVSADFWFTFDYGWTALYIYDPIYGGRVKMTPGPEIEGAHFKYFGIKRKGNFDNQGLLLKIGATIIMTVSIVAFFMFLHLRHRKKQHRFEA